MSELPPEEDDPVESRRIIVTLAVLVEGGLVVAAVVLGWWLDRHPLTNCRLDLLGVAAGIVATVPVIGVALLLLHYPIGPLRSMRALTRDVIVPAMQNCTRVDLFCISCLAGLGEEMLFRGIVQDGLLLQVQPWQAIVLASLLFGLVHAVSVTYMVFATLMGVYLGVLYMLSENLLAPILTHALYDFVLLYWLVYGPGAKLYDSTEEEPDDTTSD